MFSIVILFIRIFAEESTFLIRSKLSHFGFSLFKWLGSTIFVFPTNDQPRRACFCSRYRCARYIIRASKYLVVVGAAESGVRITPPFWSIRFRKVGTYSTVCKSVFLMQSHRSLCLWTEFYWDPASGKHIFSIYQLHWLAGYFYVA